MQTVEEYLKRGGKIEVIPFGVCRLDHDRKMKKPTTRDVTPLGWFPNRNRVK